MLPYVNTMAWKAAAGELLAFVDGPPPPDSGMVDAGAMLMDALLVDRCADTVRTLVGLGVRVTASRLLRHALTSAANGAISYDSLACFLSAREWEAERLAEACMRVVTEEAAPVVVAARGHLLRARVAARVAHGASAGEDFDQLECFDDIHGTDFSWGHEETTADAAATAAAAAVHGAARFVSALAIAVCMVQGLCIAREGTMCSGMFDEAIATLSELVCDLQAIKDAAASL